MTEAFDALMKASDKACKHPNAHFSPLPKLWTCPDCGETGTLPDSLSSLLKDPSDTNTKPPL